MKWLFPHSPGIVSNTIMLWATSPIIFLFTALPVGTLSEALETASGGLPGFLQ